MSNLIRKTRASRGDSFVGGVVVVVIGLLRGIVIGGLVGGFGAVGVVGVGVGGGIVGGVLGGIVGSFNAKSDVQRGLRGRRAPTRLGVVSAPRVLRWVRGLLPGDEGAAWLAEVNSCLAETADPCERRRYVRSYRREVPRLVWTSWSEHLSASHSRELS